MTLKKIKTYMMPISMSIGIIFYNYLYALSFITPYLIWLMLFVSYTNVPLREIKITKLHIWLLLIQILGSVVAYLLVSFFDKTIAQGVMICILAPTATSAVVIARMLGGNVSSLASYTLASNLLVVVAAPIIFSLVGNNTDISFWTSLTMIFQKVFLLLILPFFSSLLLGKIFPLGHEFIRKQQSISFYLWNMALIIVTAKTVMFIMNQDEGNYFSEIIIGLLALLICVLQFVAGRYIGRKYNDTVAGGQGLGQKNTVLAIWMSQTYLNPISSIGPGAYVLWQNIVNSYQIWKNR